MIQYAATAGEMISMGFQEIRGQAFKPTNDKCGETLKNEDPGPTTKATNPIHTHDTISEQTTKGTSGGSSGEENGHSEATLVSFIPHSDTVSLRVRI
jgi:hypothetical protein